MSKKVLLLWDRMGDYHRARWKALAELMGSENCLAADLGAGDGLYHWENTGHENHYIRLSELPVDKVSPVSALKVFIQMVKLHRVTHVCIPGYGRLAYVLMLMWCRWKRIPVLMFAESWYKGNVVTDMLKGAFIRWTTSFCFVSGQRAFNHFSRRLNYPQSQMAIGYSVVDNVHFASSTTPKQMPPQLLCVARFAPEKNLELLISAFQQSQLAKKWQLMVVGGGSLGPTLQHLVRSSQVVLTDWLSYQQLPELYGNASCFILPSSFEPWGLVVNEAMAAGLPVILSDEVGALPELLNEGVNGWRFSANDEQSLVNVFNQMTELSLGELEEMGMQSKILIKNFSTQTWAQQIFNFCAITPSPFEKY
jgi:glycosyltransferase involved in cell wall biosynthesis